MSGYSYSQWSEMSDKALIAQIGAFVQHHRLKQNRSQAEVSKAAGLSRSTLSLLERGEKINLISLIQILRVLDLLHVMQSFEFSTEISPMAYAKMRREERQRASGSGSVNEPDSEEWSW